MIIHAQRLDSVCDILMGQAPSGKAYNDKGEGWPLIAGAGDFGDLYPAAKKFTTEASRLSKAGDIVLGVRASIGDKVIADGEYCLGRGVAGLSAKEGLDGRYLWNWLTHIRPILVAKGKGATFKQINKEDIKGLNIVLPPVSEQRRIAAILDQADALRAKRREALAQLDALQQAIFIEMFGEHVDIPNSQLGKIVSMKRGPFGGALKKENFVPRGPMVYEQRNAIKDDCLTARYYISEIKFREMAGFEVLPNDLIVSCSGTIGKVAIAPPNAPRGIINQALLRIRVDSSVTTPLYLKHALESQNVQNKLTGLSHGTGLQNFPPMSEVKALSIPLPSLEKQRTFEAKLGTIKEQVNLVHESVVELDRLFTSLQHRAFRGEL